MNDSNWQVVEAVATAVAAAGIGAAGWAAWLAKKQLEELKITRQADVLLDISRRWDGADLVEARRATGRYATPEALRDRVADLRRQNANEYYVLIREPNFYEDLAILVEHKRWSSPSFGRGSAA